MDETNIKVKGRWRYLYRAVDKAGDSIDFLLRAHRDKPAARRFFEKAIGQNGSRPSGHQTPNATDAPKEVPLGHAWVQGFSLCAHHSGRHRSDAHDRQGADEMP